jgi:hypothetical protein
VVTRARAPSALRAGTAWVAAQPHAQAQRAKWWPRLLACLRLGDAGLEDLRELWESYRSAGLPSLGDALVALLLAWGEKAELALKGCFFDLVGHKWEVKEQKQRIEDTERRIAECQSCARRLGRPD